jgi:hypothetical protein
VDAGHGREQGQYSSRRCRQKTFGKKGEGTELPGTGTGVLRCMHAGGVEGGMWRDQRVSVLLLNPVRKGVGESRAEKETEVGIKRAVPSVPITDQRLWARWVFGWNNVGEERGTGRERQGTTGGGGQGRAVRL